MSDEKEINRKIYEAFDRVRGSHTFHFFGNTKLLEAIGKIRGIKELNKILDDVKLIKIFSDNHISILPIYLLNFINDLSKIINFKTHLDPWLTLTSPCNFFDFGKTIAYCINTSEFEAISTVYKNKHSDVRLGNGLGQLDELKTTFDLITSIPPFGVKLTALGGGKAIEVNGMKTKDYSSTLIVKSSLLLNENGMAVFLVANSFFSNGTNESILNNYGLYIDAIFAVPSGELSNTSMPSNLVVIKRARSNKCFVAELTNNEDMNRAILENYNNEADGIDGLYVESGAYHGFDRIKAQQQIDRLETQYKNYKQYILNDLAIEINYVKAGELFQEKDNAIYIPKIGNSKVVSKLSDTTIKHQNYFQIVLNDFAINEYVMSFFRSEIGKLSIESITTGSFISHVNKKDIQQVIVALPSLNEQKSIVQTQNKLNELKLAIDSFDQELALNPTSSTSILAQLDKMIDAIGALTDADKIRGCIRAGESKHVEFKETLSLDVKKQAKEKYIEDSALKNVVAFLNTDGGTLLIGVSDDGGITGLDIEISKFHKSVDKFLLHWKNLLKSRIGEEYYHFLEYGIVEIDAKSVLLVECSASESPCYLDEKDFYVRTNPATDKLEGHKLVEYVKSHFK